MEIVRLDEAQSRLPELVDSVVSGDGIIVITRGDRPVALLTAANSPQHSLRSMTPSSAGSVLRPLSPEDDLLDEMVSE